MDEFVRLRSLESLAVAAAVTAGLSIHLRLPRIRGISEAEHVLGVGSHGFRLGRARLPALRVLAMKNLVRELRTERGWSQGDLADKLEVSRQTINAIETGRTTPACRSLSPSRSCSANRSKRSFSRSNTHENEDFRGPRARALPARARVFRSRRNSKPARCRSSRIGQGSGAHLHPGPGQRLLGLARQRRAARGKATRSIW